MTADATEGVWKYAMGLARTLHASGIEILLVVMGPPLSHGQRAEVARLEHVGLREKPFALEWMNDPWRDVMQAGDWLLELEEQFEPHVIHLNHYCYGSLPWNAPVLISAHGCVLSWWQAVHDQQPPRSWSRYHAEVAAGLRGANIVVASTRVELDALTRLYSPIPLVRQSPLRFPCLRVIRHGCDAGDFRPMTKRHYVFSMGCVGDETLNFEMLDAVAEDLPWPVVLAGKGSSEEKRKDPFAHINFLDAPTADEIAFKLGHAAIFALPTRYEPFGFAVLEAALAGCALVLGDIPSLRETWGDAALFAPPDDRKAFAAVLNGIIEDANLRRKMAVRAREFALTLTPQRIADGIYECYREILVRQTAPMEMDVR